DPSSAAFPTKRLTMIGGDFIGWTNDGRQAFWSIGRSFLRWDPAVADSMDKVKARTDSIRADSLKGDAFKALADSVQKRLRVRAHPWPTWGIHETQVWKYLANLAWGVTTTRDPQTSTTDVLTYADLVETGEILGPRIFHTGPGVFWDEDFKSLEDTRQALRRYSDFYRINTIKMYMTGNRKQRQWVI